LKHDLSLVPAVAPLRAAAALACVAVLSACGGSQPRMGAPVQAYEVRLQEQFTAADTDGDEQLTSEEFAKGFPDVDIAFKDVDSDGNGRLSYAELKAYAQWRRIAEAHERRAQ
jgi:hypothetical protein